jgi:hypothetical protein
MKLKNILIGTSIFVAYNICCFQYIKNERKKKNNNLKFEIKDIKL